MEKKNQDFSLDIQKYARRNGMETVFSCEHNYYDRIFYDPREGAYYDRYSDVYLTYEDLKGFGIPS